MPYEQLVAEQQREELRRAAKMLPMAVKSVLVDPISICLNLSSTSATRAEAAFRVARSINTVDGRQAGCSIDDCLPWYVLSSQLGHIRGSHEHALALIARNGFRVHRRSFTVVPIVVLSNDETITPKGEDAVDQSVINAWTVGLSIVRFARSGLFRGWDAKHFRSAIYLLTDWSLLGTQLLSHSRPCLPHTAIQEWAALSDAWPFLVLGAVQDSADEIAPLADYSRLRAEIQCALACHAARKIGEDN